MGSVTIIFAFLATCLIISTTEAAGSGSCPLASKVYSCSPKCKDNYECTHGKVCCPNSCNAKSCSEPAPYGGSGGGDKYSQSGGGGIYCANVKCNSYEVCKTDPSTKRQKCSRP